MSDFIFVDSWEKANSDRRAFMDWQDWSITTPEAIHIICKNNKQNLISEMEFKKIANSLGYHRMK